MEEGFETKIRERKKVRGENEFNLRYPTPTSFKGEQWRTLG